MSFVLLDEPRLKAMSISPLESPYISRVVKEAGVLERGHAVLNSGRHTMHKVHLDRIIASPITDWAPKDCPYHKDEIR
jgi:hypothetical protein